MPLQPGTRLRNYEILYEMAAGKRTFRRDTNAETLAAVFKEEPEPLSNAGAWIAPSFREIVASCLAKDPAQRYASASALARDLKQRP